jgi:glyoxylate/hydroxypyruvate reductase A
LKTVLVLLQSNADRWAELLRKALPDHRVVTDAAQVQEKLNYVVTGVPAKGVLAALHPYEVLFSVNAGVERLLEDGTVPKAYPIVRMVDDGLAEGMLEWVMATVLAWHRNLFEYRTQQSTQTWQPLPEKLARNRTIAILGAGHLGTPVSKLLVQMGFRTRVWSRSPKALDGVACFNGPDGLAPAIDATEILINLLPLTPATENLLGSQVFAHMAYGGVVINGGRGRHVVDQELIEALDSGQLRAAVLDVFREEPLPAAHPFWHHPKVYVSPHVAALTHPETAIEAIVANLRGYEAGEPLKHVVIVDRGY